MIFLTDDSRAERTALSRTFPHGKLLLCCFHLLQAVWRWLCCKENDISMSDRATLSAVIEDTLNARRESLLHSCYHEALESSAFNRSSTARGSIGLSATLTPCL
uniref:MULE transposase domain-containing protein n=1 Tax=Myripristis murdjan TaxID=586833 RepID=A0A668A7Q5_9TELE